jgi:hypothetical protein
MRRFAKYIAAHSFILALSTASLAGDSGDIPIADQIIFPYKFFYESPHMSIYTVHYSRTGLHTSKIHTLFLATNLDVLWLVLIKLDQRLLMKFMDLYFIQS